jgi:hypothetical protein
MLSSNFLKLFYLPIFSLNFTKRKQKLIQIMD